METATDFAKSRDFIAGNAPLAAVAGDFYGSGHVDLAIINTRRKP